MPSADFAAAQERLAARRRQRETEARAREAAQRASHPRIVSRLPYPFNRLGNAGLSVWDTIKGREGTNPAFRVGQVDAELLDDELLELLKGQVGDALKYLGSHLQDEYAAEIRLLLQAVLFKLTIWDHDASYGASLQGLRYTDARDVTPARKRPTKWQKSIYGLVTVFGRYGWTKWEEYLLENSDDYAEPSPRLRMAQKITSTISTTHSVSALASFLVFLVNGRYRTLLDRILRMRLAPTSHATSREVSFEYLNRQLVWHAFTEFLLFLLPLVGISRWRRIASRTWRKIKYFFLHTILGRQQAYGDDEVKASGELGFLPLRTCAICYKDQNTANGASENELLAASASGGVIGSASTDITNPYEALPCGCVYCYVCLAQRIDSEEGEGWTCLRCGEVVKECKPWSGDLVEESPREISSSHVKSVGFSEDASPSGEEGNIREIEPIAEVDGETGEASGDMSMLGASEFTAASGLYDSAEWAKARDGSSEEDSQSEEYDEEEAEMGDDIEYEL